MSRGHHPSERGRAARPAAREPREPAAYGRGAGLFNKGGSARSWIARSGAPLLGLCLLLATAGPAGAHVPVILAFGDSLFAGYGLPAKESFPSQLEARLKRQGITAKMLNGGVSGDTTADGVARLGWALADKPDFVLLELGANDMLRCIDPAAVRANLDTMIRRFRASGAKVLLLGMRATPDCGPDYQRRFDRLYPELAQRDHVPLYPFFLQGVAMKPQLNQPDMKHPNARGVAVLVARIAPWVARLVQGSAA
jgi:acyl-CoA thioesterase-1